MKWIAAFALALCLLFLLPKTTFAQNADAPNPPAKEKQKEEKPPATKWTVLRDGVSLQRLWIGREYPEIAVLKLSDDKRNEFLDAPAKFINGFSIFPKPVRDPAGPCVSLTAIREPQGPWIVIVTHSRPSAMYCAIVPEPPESDGSGAKH
jgi:hypothetical protein